MENKRFLIIFERHVGFGIWWNSDSYTLDVSIAFPFFIITIGLGRDKSQPSQKQGG